MTTTATNYPGIDYSLGRGANQDPATGIRYGVISQHSIPYWYEASEAHYPGPFCPHCGEDLETDDPESLESCPHCKEEFEGVEEFYAEEASSFTYEGEGLAMESAFDNTEVFVLKSPYFTYAQYCSPCAPGAGNLNSPCPDGPKTFCPGHDWFEDEKAPYPVYSVETGKEVFPA